MFKIINNTLYFCDNWGNLHRKIADNVSLASYDDKSKTFLVTKKDGKLELINDNSTVLRTLHLSVTEGRYQGDQIVARLKDGRNCIIDKNGNIQRWL
jgi:hypothetical protein